VSAIAAEAWRFRTLVERQAVTRFAHFADELPHHGFASLAALAAQASDDERRHAALCLDLAETLNAPAITPDAGWAAPRLAPKRFGPREALIYEVVAQCCVGETESMATLSTLMEQMAPSRYRDAVHEIARDEVTHARLGWALLEQMPAAPTFLHGHLVSMLEAGGGPLFQAAVRGSDDAELVAWGVLPHRLKRRVFEETLREVIVPGFTRSGIDCGEIGVWLDSLAQR
jgi:rubrerythrin